jgi:hypothetical protein
MTSQLAIVSATATVTSTPATTRFNSAYSLPNSHRRASAKCYGQEVACLSFA